MSAVEPTPQDVLNVFWVGDPWRDCECGATMEMPGPPRLEAGSSARRALCRSWIWATIATWTGSGTQQAKAERNGTRRSSCRSPSS